MREAKKLIEDSIDKVMLGLQERRERLGMVGLPEPEAQLRALALEAMPTEAFQKLLAIDDDQARENEIQALVNAQRRHHAMMEVRAVARSSIDGRILFRWFCACGEESLDYFSAENARNGWGKHAGWIAPPKEREVKLCEGCDRENHTRGRFHSRACRLKWESEHGC